MLVGSSGFVPLDDFGSGCGFFFGDVEALVVEYALEEEALSLFDPSPSLVETLVLLPLDQSFSVLEGGLGDVDCFSGLGVDEDAGLVEGVGVVDWDDVEELVEGVGVELFVSEDSFEGDCLCAFG